MGFGRWDVGFDAEMHHNLTLARTDIETGAADAYHPRLTLRRERDWFMPARPMACR